MDFVDLAMLLMLLVITTKTSTAMALGSNCSSEISDQPHQQQAINCTSSSHVPHHVSAVQQSSRRLISNSNISDSGGGTVGRNNKLMSVLAARRTALSRDRWRISRGQHDHPVQQTMCERNCTKNFTARASAQCMRRCAPLRNRLAETSNIEPVKEEENISETNTITNGKDELLQTEESAHHGLIVVHPDQDLETVRRIMNTTKLGNNNSLENADRLLKVNSTLAKDSFSSSKIVRPYMDIRIQRMESAKQRQKTATDKSVEESELAPYLFFGQKLPPSKINESKNQVVTTKRSPYISSISYHKHSSKIREEDEEEIMEVSVPRVSTTEKNKFWQQNRLYYPSRNIVAFNRRGNPTVGLHHTPHTKITIVTTPVTNVESTPFVTVSTIATTSLKPVPLQEVESIGSRFGDEEDQKWTKLDIISIPENESSNKMMALRSTNLSEPIENHPNIKGILLEVPSSSLSALDIPTKENHPQHKNVDVFRNQEGIMRAPETITNSEIVEINNFPEVTIPPEEEERKLLINVPDNIQENITKLSTEHVPIMPEEISNISVATNPTTTPTTMSTLESVTTIILTTSPDPVPVVQIETTTPNLEEDFYSRTYSAIPNINIIFSNISTVASPPDDDNFSHLNLPVSTSTSKSISKTTFSTSVRSTSVPKVVLSTSPPNILVEEIEVDTSNTSTTSTTSTTTPFPITTNAPVTEAATTTTSTISSLTTSTTTSTTTISVPSTSTSEINSQSSSTTSTSIPIVNNITDPIFIPIFNLSSIFPKFPGITQKSPPVTNYSNILPTANISSTKKPISSLDGILLRHNSDVTIEMHRMNMATYVLAGLGMFPIVIIILYVVKTVLFKKQTKATNDLERYINDDQPISPVVKLEDSSSGDESMITERDFNRNNLRFKSLLGEGNFGQVWKAEADDLAGHLGTTRIVAVKTERAENGQGGLRGEADIMHKLGSHPNVVTLLGACIDQEPHLLIMEFAMRGRLLSLLRAARSAVHSLPPSVPGSRGASIPLSPRRLSGFAHDIARGMEYISSKKIVHRDLAARNILLDHNGVCKICDFGMSIDLDKSKQSQPQTRKADFHRQAGHCIESRFRWDSHFRPFSSHDRKLDICRSDGNHGTKIRPALPIRWMAPEALQYHIFSPETDVWAFGIVVWEIATLGCTPYPNLSGREVVRNVPNGIRPEIPPDCRPELYELMTKTWRKDPRQRPTFTEARNDLAHALRQWEIDQENSSEYLDVSGFSEDLEHGMVYFNRRISEFECDI